MTQKTLESIIFQFQSKTIKKQVRSKYSAFKNYQIQLPIIRNRKKSIDLFDDDQLLYRPNYNNNISKSVQRSSINPMNLSTQLNRQIQQIRIDLQKYNKKEVQLQFSPIDNELKLRMRQNFKKYKTPMEILKLYIKKTKINLSQQQLKLLEEILYCHGKLQRYIKSADLDHALQILYSLLSMTVDVNQMHFFCLVIQLIAQICHQMQNFNKSFYFYNQLRLVCTYIKNYELKIDAFIGLATNASQLQFYMQSIIFLKKALQYAWIMNNKQKQLLIYDFMGMNYYYLGNLNKSQYFHNRFVHGIIQKKSSSNKSISAQILNQFHRHIVALQELNLTSLFLQYFKLPIKRIEDLPVQSKKIYQNYGKNGQSPRQKNPRQFIVQMNAQQIINQIFIQDQQFMFEIPDPINNFPQKYIEVIKNVNEQNKFIRKDRQKDTFQRSRFYRERLGRQIVIDKNIENRYIYKNSLQQRIERRLKDNMEEDWQQKVRNRMKIKMRSIDNDKVKDRIMNSNHEKNIENSVEGIKSKKLKHINYIYNELVLQILDPKEKSKR